MADEPWTILKILEWTRDHFAKKGVQMPRLDAEVLLAHALGLERVMLYAKFDQPVFEEERTAIRELVARRSRFEPVAYLTGQREFWSMDFEVTPEVLIPRPETETLVELGLEALKAHKAPTIIDVGTGSGCIALALAQTCKDARVFALERAPGALEVAKRNCKKHGLQDRVHLIESDLLRELPTDAVPADLIVANLPYIEDHELEALPADVRDYEPVEALAGGRDGLTLIRTLIQEAEPSLGPGGTILLEASPHQLESVCALLTSAGFAFAQTKRDDDGTARAALAQKQGRPAGASA